MITAKEVLAPHMATIGSILTKAENEIEHLTGLILTVEVATDRIKLDDEQELIKTYVKKFCEIWHVDAADLYKRDRKPSLVTMRFILFHFLKTKFKKLSYSCIGKHFNNLDHSTIVYGVMNSSKFLKTKDELFMNYYNPIKHFYEQ